MASPVSDDIACFDSLPDDLVGVIMSKLDFPSAVRLTQACPTARRLVQGERAVPGVLGMVFVHLPDGVDEGEFRVQVTHDSLGIRQFKATMDKEDDAKRIACIVHMLEWIRVRASAFAKIAFIPRGSGWVLDQITDTFLPNVPSSFRGKIVFAFKVFTKELARLPTFLAAWRALAPAYECGLAIGCPGVPSDLIRALLQAAPPLSILTVPGIRGPAMPGFKFLESMDTSRLTALHASQLVLESLPSEDVLPPKLHNLSLSMSSGCLSGLDAFLAPLHRLTALTLFVYSTDEQLDSPLTLAPFTVLPNLRLLRIRSSLPPAVESDYWRESIVLPILVEFYLEYDDFTYTPVEEGGPAAGQPSRWPTLLSNLEAPKLERLEYRHWASDRVTNCYRTLDLPLGRFPRLRYFYAFVSKTEKVLLDLPALRAEIATLRHLQKPRPGDIPCKISRIAFYAKDPVPEEEVKAWELELGFRMSRAENDVDVDVEFKMCPYEED